MANERAKSSRTPATPRRPSRKYRYAASLLDQISRDDPKWQPIVVDYRKKRVSENITRLEQQARLPAREPRGRLRPSRGRASAEGGQPHAGPQRPDGAASATAGSRARLRAAAGGNQEVHDQISSSSKAICAIPARS